MLELILITVGLLAVYLAGHFSQNRRKVSTRNQFEECKELPGPICLPIFGYLPLFFTNKRLYANLTSMSQKYGPLFQIKLGFRTIVVIRGLNLIKRAMNESTFASRPAVPSIETFGDDGQFHRFTFMPADGRWKFYRRNTIKALALFSTSKNSRLQSVVEQGCRSLWMDIDENLGRPFFIKKSIFECVAGIIGAISFGIQFDRNDPILKEIVSFTDRSTLIVKTVSFLDYFPGCNWLLNYKITQFKSMLRPVNDIVDKHLKTHQFNEINVTDVADALFKRSKEINPEEYESLGLSKEHLQRTVLDLFMAGFITGLETLMWGLTCLAKNPEIQKKVQAELDEVLSGRFPTVDDRQTTPYTDATILEIFRVNSLTPFSLAHGTTQDCVFEGYFVPKGAVVLPLIWAHHNDPAIFPEPEIFRPERFIGENGTVDVDFAQNVVPFGVGKRRCVGENLARQEIYLIFASTMQQYEISLPSDEDINFDRDIIDGIITIVKPSNFIFKRRH